MTRGSASMAAAHLASGMWLAHAATASAQHRAWPAAALMATAALVAATATIAAAPDPSPEMGAYSVPGRKKVALERLRV
mgnify:CR=1 FL=1